jgi:hypothetical protein
MWGDTLVAKSVKANQELFLEIVENFLLDNCHESVDSRYRSATLLAAKNALSP